MEKGSSVGKRFSILVRMPESLKKRLDNEASRLCVHKSSLIVQALDKCLPERKDE
jgi:predicted DNA-binding protein